MIQNATPKVLPKVLPPERKERGREEIVRSIIGVSRWSSRTFVHPVSAPRNVKQKIFFLLPHWTALELSFSLSSNIKRTNERFYWNI